MERQYDLFERQTEGLPRRVDAAENLREARKKLERLAAASPGVEYLFTISALVRWWLFAVALGLLPAFFRTLTRKGKKNSGPLVERGTIEILPLTRLHVSVAPFEVCLDLL